jgi:curved DNA-binding protein CbpA
MPEDHYHTLNIPSEASPDEIQRSYRALARRYHPDHNPLPAAASTMVAINAAYEIVSDPAKRAEYDRSNRKQNPAIDDLVITAARETLKRQGWNIVEDGLTVLLLKNGTRKVRVSLTRLVTGAALRQYVSQFPVFHVVLAAHIDPTLTSSPGDIAVIDLMHSRLHAGSFPDPTYRSLFARFL